MSRRAELISPEGKKRFLLLKIIFFFQGLRLDGRRANELRSINAAMGVVSGRLSDGSSSFEIGNTRILATVYGPRELPSGASSSAEAGAMNMATPMNISDSSDTEKGSICVKMHAASFSSTGGERRKNARQDR